MTGWRSVCWRSRRARGFAIALALGFALAGCAALGGKPPPSAPDIPASKVDSADALTPAVPPPPPATRPARRPRTASAARPAPPKAAAIDPDRLIGLDPDAVRGLMGPPSQVRDQDISREWIYAARDCSFRVIFYPNLNAASFRVLKYGGSNSNGGLLDVSDACIRRILTARKNGAD